MSQAENFAILFDTGHKDQSRELAINMSVTLIQDWNNESTVFVFDDGSGIYTSGSEFRVATKQETEVTE
jgi:hypothetical protein